MAQHEEVFSAARGQQATKRDAANSQLAASFFFSIPLAQLRYKQAKVNHSVPSETYSAVAEELAYVYQLKGKRFRRCAQLEEGTRISTDAAYQRGSV